jgi:hypothetical protein
MEAASAQTAKEKAIELVYERIERCVPSNRVGWRRVELSPN